MGDIKFGICQWAIPLKGPYGCMVAKDFGLDGVELELGEYENGFPLSKRVVQDIYRKIRDEKDVRYPSLATNAHLKYGMTNPVHTGKGNIARLILDTAITTAETLHIPIIQVPSFENGEIQNAEGFKNTVEHLRYACDRAADAGIIIGTENLLSIEENKGLFEHVGKENLRLFFDTQNYALFKGYHPAEMIDELKDSICQTHVKDGNNQMSASLLGFGNSGYAESVSAFKKAGYKGWVILENYYDVWPLLKDHTTDPFALWKQDISIVKDSFRD